MNVIILVVLGALVIVVGLLWWQLVALKSRYSVFFAKADAKSLQAQLNNYATDVDDALNKLDQLADFSAKLHQKNELAISKVGLVRFNPFGDTGGDQSFCLVLLDHHNTGLSISSIHARSGTRFYAKEIQQGQPLHPLSDEEQAAYNKAVGKASKA